MSNFLELIKLAGCKEPRDTGSFWRTNAVWRGGEHYNVSINKETGYWKDYVTLDSGPFSKFCELCGIKKEIENNEQKVNEEVKLQRINYKRYSKECLAKLEKNYKFYTKRNISIETLETFDCGLAKNGRFYNRMCFPVFDKEGAIIGFAGRKIEEDTERPKWLIHGPKRLFLYPTHLNDFVLKVKAEVILVESIGDVLALWEMGIYHVLCLFGLEISPKIMAYLLEISPEKIIISTNNETRGWAGAARIRKKLKQHFPNSKIKTVFPINKDWADSLNEKLIWKRKLMV